MSGPYSLVALLHDALPETERSAPVSWPGKAGVTFFDAEAAVRLWLKWTPLSRPLGPIFSLCS